MKYYPGVIFERKELLDRIGSISQIGGLRRVRLQDGVEKGVEVVEFETGSGLKFDVLLDRGMDISRAVFRGANLAWRSPVGDAHPSRYEEPGLGWLRTFPGGMVTTCGLTYMGAPGRDGDQELGLHGRYSSLPASKICQWEGWEGEDYILRLSGEMREAMLFGDNQVLRRVIESKLGSSTFTLTDTVTNEGCRPAPPMLLYHCNFGYPLLDEKTVLETPHSRIEPRDAEAAEGLEEACRVGKPVPGYREKVYFHNLEHDKNGYVSIFLRNPVLLGGLSLELRYRPDQLPHFTQWKMIGQQEYVLGLEPGNARVLGRAREREAGRLITLEPGETRTYRLEFTLRVLAEAE